jgi:hypothetical protein
MNHSDTLRDDVIDLGEVTSETKGPPEPVLPDAIGNQELSGLSRD